MIVQENNDMDAIPHEHTIPSNPTITNKPHSILSIVQSLRNKLSLLDLKYHQLHRSSQF